MKTLIFGFLLGVCITNFAWGIAIYSRNKARNKDNENYIE